MTPEDGPPLPDDLPDDLPGELPPPIPPAPPTLWGRIAVGFLPAACLLVVMFMAFALDPGGDTALPLLIVAGIAFVLGTPLLMVPWSGRLLNRIHGPAAPEQRSSRIGMIALVTVGMSFANFCVVFAGCSAILLVMG